MRACSVVLELIYHEVGLVETLTVPERSRFKRKRFNRIDLISFVPGFGEVFRCSGPLKRNQG